MSYPIEIIPKWTYRRSLDLGEVLMDFPAFFVCRIIEKPIDEIILKDEFDNTEILDLDEINENIVHMSVNLMGAVYKEEHFKFRTTGQASGDWLGEHIDMGKYANQYRTLQQAYPIYYSSDTLHRKKLPWCIQVAEKNKRKAVIEAFGEKCLTFFGDLVKGECEVFIKHCPTKLNYWHMQVELKPALKDDDKLLKKDDGWRRDIYIQYVSDVLSRKFLRCLPPDYLIPGCRFCGFESSCKETGLLPSETPFD